MSPRARLTVLASLLSLSALRAQPTSSIVTAPVRFGSVEIFVDPRGSALAAYQLEFVADPARVALVGIEGGEHVSFRQPPYYDPAALNRNRVILAAFSTNSDLPTSRTRVATLHVRISGDQTPTYSTRLITAADPQGRPIAADVSVSEGAIR